MTTAARIILSIIFLIGSGSWHAHAEAADQPKAEGRVWKQLVAEAEKAGLPTKFLKVVPPEFVKFEFDDLQTFAAEYHPSEHRMVLNRTLSFNSAGGTLRPLNRLTPTQIETLYHELFHAYMDYLATEQTSDRPAPLLTYARTQQRCRYSAVLINPVVQRKSESEERFLTEQESWEALNEAWAVFIGWAVWNQLESGKSPSIEKPGKAREGWIRRLKEADRDGKIRGYYEPEAQEERAVARKRYLAPESRVSPDEMVRLMDEALGYPAELIQQATKQLASGTKQKSGGTACSERS